MKLPFRNKFSSNQLQHVDQRDEYTELNDFTLPTGFWYGIKEAWLEFLENEGEFDGEGYNYNYEVRFKRGVLTDIAHPDPNKVLVITVEFFYPVGHFFYQLNTCSNQFFLENR